MAIFQSVTFCQPAAVACCLMMFGLLVRVAAQEPAVDIDEVVRQAAETMRISKFATLATIAADGTISGRMVYPKPPNATLGESPNLYFVRFATLSHSRKFKELQANPHATLVYYDDAGKGEVTLKGVVSVCSPSEAAEGWYNRWKSNYPQGPATPFYTLLRFESTSLEFVSYLRYSVNEGQNRSDWRPLTLSRRPSPDSAWEYNRPPPDPAEVIE